MPTENNATLERVVGTLFALGHGKYAEVLKAEAACQYYESLKTIVRALHQDGGGEFMTQLFLTDDPDQLSDSNTISWVAIKNTVRIDPLDETRIAFHAGHALLPQPSDGRDLLSIPQYGELPVITIEFDSVLPTFDHTAYLPPHS